MKIILPLFLVIALFFTNCNKDDNSPDGNLSAAPCCTFSSPGLSYNPVISVSGSTPQPICYGNVVYTNSNGDITDIVVQFHSYCTGYDQDWLMEAGISAGLGPPIISGNIYNISWASTTSNSPTSTFLFYDFNCTQATTADVWTNVNSTVIDMVKFDVDWANNEIGGTFTLTGLNLSGLPSKTVVCTFSNMPIQVISM